MAERETTLTELTATVVGAYIGNHKVAVTDLPGLIREISAALGGADVGGGLVADDVERPTAAAIRKSIKPDGLVSFLDNRSYKSLKRHIGTHGMTPEEYRTRFGLPVTYPMVSANYSEARSRLAKAAGLGQGVRSGRGKAPEAPEAAPANVGAKVTRGRSKKPVQGVT